MPKYIVSQPVITLCIESRSSKSPTTTSAPFSRKACARSSSLRTIARTALPCFNNSSVTVRPTAPTRPAAPVTRMGFAMLFPPSNSSSLVRWRLCLLPKLEQLCPHQLFRKLALKRRQEFFCVFLLQMEIVCGLRRVDLEENKRIGILLSRRLVESFHTRFRPHQRQVLAGGFQNLGPVLRWNFRLEQKDNFFVRHVRLLSETEGIRQLPSA